MTELERLKEKRDIEYCIYIGNKGCINHISAEKLQMSYNRYMNAENKYQRYLASKKKV